MNTLIKIIDVKKQQSRHLLCNSKKLDNVWANIKVVISTLINKNYDEGVNFINIYNGLHSVKGYYEENSLSKYDFFIDDYVDILVHENKVSYKAYKIKDNTEFVTYAATNVFKVMGKGNCVDTFLEKGVVGIVDGIKEYIDDIKSRQDERNEFVEYHQTSCYEKDFNRIYVIKALADKLSKNCSEQLEKLSEKYTKIV